MPDDETDVQPTFNLVTKTESDADRKKTLAEAEAAQALARKNDAEADKLAAEAEGFRANAAKSAAEADFAKSAARKAAIEIEREEEKRRDELTANKYHHRYVFDSDVRDASVKNCINQLTTWSRNDPGCDIEIILNSPGGDVIEGFALIDFLFSLQQEEPRHRVTTHALGMAASMAGVILQAGGTRIMGKNSILLIHEASFGAVGSYGEVKDRVKLVDLMHERILDLFETRAKAINPKTTKAFIRKNWDRTDWWIAGEQALRLGFVDQLA